MVFTALVFILIKWVYSIGQASTILDCAEYGAVELKGVVYACQIGTEAPPTKPPGQGLPGFIDT